MELHNRWKQNDTKLQTTIDTGGFTEAVDIMQRIAELAEEHNHHPDLAIHDYDQLTITLSSHDVGEVTDRDYALAAAIDEIL